MAKSKPSTSSKSTRKVGQATPPTEQAVIVVYTGEGKGKTSASLGLLLRALGAGLKISYLQFIKHWQVSEHLAIDQLLKIYPDNLEFYKGGKGFYNAGEMSAKGVSDQQHHMAAKQTYELALSQVREQRFDLVICDEINNAVHDGLLKVSDLEELIDQAKTRQVSLCLTGRNFPEQLLDKVSIATKMTKLKHHYDQGHLATRGIDF